jgi:hypothetical protein
MSKRTKCLRIPEETHARLAAASKPAKKIGEFGAQLIDEGLKTLVSKSKKGAKHERC